MLIMMKIKQRHLVLVALFLTFFITRSLISMQNKNFGDDTSYYVMRQVEHISEYGKPIQEDNLSYGGRNFIIMPFYYCFMSFFYKLTSSVLILKIINNFFASTIIFGVYILSVKIIKNRTIALFCGVVASSIPIYLNQTINNLNPYSIVAPLTFFILTMFLKLNKNVLNYLIPLTIIFILSSFDSVLLVIGILSYIIYIYLENKNLEKAHIEYASFFLLFFLWVNFLIYKDAFQIHGFSIILFKNSLSLNMFNFIGIPLILLGLYSVYLYSSKKKSVYMTLFISLLVSNFLLLWLKLVPINTLIIMSMYLVILMGQALREINLKLQKAKISKFASLIMSLIFIILAITQVFPGFFLYNQGFSDKYIEGFEWIKNNTEENSTILSVPEEGHLITYISNRKNVVDTEYLLVDYEKRTTKIIEMYTQKFKTKILDVMGEYDADYLILSDKILKYNIKIQDTIFFSDPCFELVYNGEIKVFKKCER